MWSRQERRVLVCFTLGLQKLQKLQPFNVLTTTSQSPSHKSFSLWISELYFSTSIFSVNKDPARVRAACEELWELVYIICQKEKKAQHHSHSSLLVAILWPESGSNSHTNWSNVTKIQMIKYEFNSCYISKLLTFGRHEASLLLWFHSISHRKSAVVDYLSFKSIRSSNTYDT